jgi:hypothetical protein
MALALASGHWFGHLKGPVAIFDLDVASSALITNPLIFRRRLSSGLFPFPESIPELASDRCRSNPASLIGRTNLFAAERRIHFRSRIRQ